MNIAPDTNTLDVWGRAVTQGLARWWHMVFLGAVLLVVGLSPSTYNRANRTTIARYLYASTLDVLPWFTAMTALLCLVLIRVVVVTAQSYGLSQYALEMVVRVLVLELIPLSAAMFIALRAGLTLNASSDAAPVDTRTQNASGVSGFTLPSIHHLRDELVPRVLACAFSVVTLATVSSLIALVLAYLTVHGFSPWGLPGYTRTVGHVFDLQVTLGFAIKTVFFSLAVAVVPLAANLENRSVMRANSLQPGAVRLFLVLLLIEAASLSVKYI
jgi:phospholipid/cholesterol/gamma-HCH transport system permease protein